MERIQSINAKRIHWCCNDRSISPEELASKTRITWDSFEKMMARVSPIPPPKHWMRSENKQNNQIRPSPSRTLLGNEQTPGFLRSSALEETLVARLNTMGVTDLTNRRTDD